MLGFVWRVDHVTLYGIGLGSGAVGLLTVRGRKQLGVTDIVYSPGRRSQGVAVEYIPESKVEDFEFPMRSAPEELRVAWKTAASEAAPRARDGDTAFVTLGDLYIYSTFGRLRRTLQVDHSDVDIEAVPARHRLTVGKPNVFKFETTNISNELVLLQPELFYVSRKSYGVMAHLSIPYEEEADQAVVLHRIPDRIEATQEKLDYKRCDRKRQISRIRGSSQWRSQADISGALGDIEYEQQRSVGRNTQRCQYR